MNIMLNRLDPHVPDPVESRRRAAGRLVRIAYATAVFGIVAFFIVYFGRPLVYLSGPGVVASQRTVVSLPYVVQIKQMYVERGATVQVGEEIGQVWSPEHENVVAAYMRGLGDIAARTAELRIKARVAADSLDTARSYHAATGEAVNRIESLEGATTTYRVAVLREHALAEKAVISQKAEVDEATSQLRGLDGMRQQFEDQIAMLRSNFGDGKIIAPMQGIVSTVPAFAGQSLVAGSPIAEILSTSDIFVDWYIPNDRFVDPRVGDDVSIHLGNWQFRGTISELLPVSEVYDSKRLSIANEREASQIARIRFKPGTLPPALNSTVHVRMYYTDFAANVVSFFARAFGLHGA